MKRPTRQELYERIRNSSKDQVILEEMRRLGFWPKRGELPNDPTIELDRRGDLTRELNALRTEFQRLHDEEAMLRELRKRRLAESRQKRKENKERRIREQHERVVAQRKRLAATISYLGEGFSLGLEKTASDEERLADKQLPVLSTSADLAQAMGISVGELRFLAYGRTTSTSTHYTTFGVRKKTGGVRVISAPMPRLKAAQRWVLDHVLTPVKLHDAAHGFVEGRSIVSNARPHVKASVVINLDLRDFFPTVTERRTRGMFKSLGYSEAVATILAMLCTQADTTEIELDGIRYFVGQGARHLPQGSPASPAITNIICRRLDRRLTGLASELGFVYTRYADDLTFSSRARNDQIGKLIRRVEELVTHEGFVVHPDKTRVMHRGRRQEVTGIVVNDGLGVSRKALRNFRAFLRQLELDGPAKTHWGQCPDAFAAAQGFASFVAMVDADKGNALLARVREAMKQQGYRQTAQQPVATSPRWQLAGMPPLLDPPAEQEPSVDEPPQPEAPEATDDEPKKKPWWKFW